MIINKKLFCGIAVIFLFILFLFIWNSQPKKISDKSGVPCGGWNLGGKAECECDGQLKKSTCPRNAMCDSGTDICYGSCGKCKCYAGGTEKISCDKTGFNTNSGSFE